MNGNSFRAENSCPEDNENDQGSAAAGDAEDEAQDEEDGEEYDFLRDIKLPEENLLYFIEKKSPALRPWQREDRLLVLSSDLPLRCALRVTHSASVIDRTHLRPATPSATEADQQPSWLPHRFIATDGADYLSVDLVALMALPAFLDIAQPDIH